MLKNEETKNPNAIEEFFCKPLDKFKPVPMTKTQMQLMLAVGSAKDENVAQMERDFTEIYWFYPAIEKRINACFTYTMDAKAKMLLATWCNTIGDVVMYLTLIQYKCKQRGLKALYYDGLALMFGDGIIDREFMHKCWDAQKLERKKTYRKFLPYGGSDNLIDYATAGKSLYF
jgi:hypothetical protein